MKTLVAVARSIRVAFWHLLKDPTSRYHDLGPDFLDNHIRQLEALGPKVTLEPAA